MPQLNKKHSLDEMNFTEVVRELEIVPIEGVVDPSVVLDVPCSLIGNESVCLPHECLALPNSLFCIGHGGTLPHQSQALRSAAIERTGGVRVVPVTAELPVPSFSEHEVFALMLLSYEPFPVGFDVPSMGDEFLDLFDAPG